MTVSVGLVGLPNVGKSTLLNAVSRAGAQAANFPFTTIEPNIGVVAVPDDRLDRIADIVGSARRTPTTIEFVDIAGLVEGASHGEGLGNQFLAAIREVDAVCHVVRCFEDPDVAHVAGQVDPVRDVEVVETELLLRDLETVDKRLERTSGQARSGDETARADVATLQRLREHLEAGEPARSFPVDGRARELLAELFLLTMKPALFVANVAEENLPDGGSEVAALKRLAQERDAEVVVVCAELEAELGELPTEERSEYLASVGLERSSLERLIHACYRLLGLVTFFTANANEAHAWTVPEGTRVQDAVGRVHTDMQRGFIRAEVVSFADLDALGSEHAAREAGRLRTEGRDYRVADGDLVEVRFRS
jgi:ribosome-binding ATPase